MLAQHFVEIRHGNRIRKFHGFDVLALRSSAQPPGDRVSTISSFFLLVAISSPDALLILNRREVQAAYHRLL